jgi:hypothetical protein
MSTPADPPKPTAAELDLLQVLWPLGATTARQCTRRCKGHAPR